MFALDGGLPEEIETRDLDLSLLVPVEPEESGTVVLAEKLTQVFLITTLLQIAFNKSLADLWGTINGM